MILTKGQLKVVEITAPDKNIPVLDNVLIEPDGTTVGCNGRAVLVVSPPAKETKIKVPLQETELKNGFTISSNAIRNVLKSIPRDTLFGGLLEYCDVEDKGDRAYFTVSDGMRKHGIEGKKYDRKYVDYKSMLQEANAHAKVFRCVVNRKRLIQMLKALEGIIPDANGEAQVCIEATAHNEILFRQFNLVNKQRAVGMITTYQGPESAWPPMNDWEAKLCISTESLFLKPKPVGGLGPNGKKVIERIKREAKIPKVHRVMGYEGGKENA